MAKKTTPVKTAPKEKVVETEQERGGEPEVFKRVPTVRQQYVEERALDKPEAGYRVKDADKDVDAV